MEPSRLFDLVYLQKEKHALDKAFGHRVNGEWEFYSTDQLIDTVNKVSRGLLDMGMKPGDKAAIVVYKNRPEWVALDLGMQQIGVINVPVYPTISPSDYQYIFNDSQVKYCFVGIGDLYDKVKEAQKNTPSLKEIYTLDKTDGLPYWEDIFSEDGDEDVQKIKDSIKPDDLASIIYTSGTTGNPKGVMLTHNNFMSQVYSTDHVLPLEPGSKVLSFLPLCHSFERTVTYTYIYKCLSVYYTGTDNLGGDEGDLKTVQPYFFTTVPRLLEKVYEKIYNKGLALTGVKKKLFFWALDLADDYDYDKKFTGLDKVKWGIADKLIFSKWREALGGNVIGIITGAAPCPVKIAKVFSAAGVRIREGYGLTETSPTLTVNLFEPGGAVLGTVGPAIEGVKLLIDGSEGEYREGEGEILAHGPNVMQGYYNNPEANEAVFKMVDGTKYLRTGDIGKFVKGPDGRDFLKITDRKKELLKTSGGKYVAPAPIENKFKEDFLIEQMMVIGDRRKFVSALIVPAEEALKDWCEKNGINWTSLENAIKEPKVIEQFQKIVDKYNPEFSHFEQVKKFALISKAWEATKSDGSKAELTPTLKLKRRVILEKFGEDIENIYDV